MSLPSSYEIEVVDIFGSRNRFNVTPETTYRELKEMVATRRGNIPTGQLKFIFNGQKLKYPNRTLREYGIVPNTIVRTQHLGFSLYDSDELEKFYDLGLTDETLEIINDVVEQLRHILQYNHSDMNLVSRARRIAKEIASRRLYNYLTTHQDELRRPIEPSDFPGIDINAIQRERRTAPAAVATVGSFGAWPATWQNSTDNRLTGPVWGRTQGTTSQLHRNSAGRVYGISFSQLPSSTPAPAPLSSPAPASIQSWSEANALEELARLERAARSAWHSRNGRTQQSQQEAEQKTKAAANTLFNPSVYNITSGDEDVNLDTFLQDSDNYVILSNSERAGPAYQSKLGGFVKSGLSSAIEDMKYNESAREYYVKIYHQTGPVIYISPEDFRILKYGPGQIFYTRFESKDRNQNQFYSLVPLTREQLISAYRTRNPNPGARRGGRKSCLQTRRRKLRRNKKTRSRK